jgi:beta-lactamase regulating signal transducer with metallopeptidase domain
VLFKSDEPAVPAVSAIAGEPSSLIAWLCLAPGVVLLAGLLLSVVRLGAMRRRAAVLANPAWLAALAAAQVRMGFKHGTALLVSDELNSPISWGLLRPTILLNPAAVTATAEAEAIVAHELAHVTRADWAKLLLARLACALFWFNPLVWLLARESHQLREEAADDAVLLADVARTDYAALLVNAARHDNAGALIAAHGVAPGRGSLKRRIARVLDARLSRAPVGAGVAAFGVLLMVGVAGPLAAFGPSMPVATARAAPLTEPDLAGMPTAPATATVSIHREESTSVTTRSVSLPAPLATPTPTLMATPAVAVTPKPGVPGSYGTVGPVSLDDIVSARALGVDPICVEQFTAIFPNVALRDIIAARAVGVTVDYARAMRKRYPSVGLRDVVRMRAVDEVEPRTAETRPPPSMANVRGPRGDIHAEVMSDGRAITRVTRGNRMILSVAEPPERPELPDDD